MATVSVSTLAEFITAIAVQGDTVVCPEGAVWDANDVYPDGYTGNIPWKADVQGNGATIKNLRFYGHFYTNEDAARVTISEIRIIDLIGSQTNGEYNAALFWGSYKMEDCTISAVLNHRYHYIIHPRDSYYMRHPNVNRCSFNIDASGDFSAFYYGDINYSRIELHLPNSTKVPIGSGGSNFTVKNCEIIAYAPNITDKWRSIYYSGCIVHGDMPTLEEGASSGSMDGDMSVYSTDAMPSFVPRDPVHFVGVTDAQLRDPSYLRSIGFPIAIEV